MNNEEKLKSSILNLESLELKFKNKLVQYKNAYNDYLSQLDKTHSSENEFKTVPGFYFAPPTLSRENATNANQCLALCSANSSCSGANYISKSGDCILYSGDSGSFVNDSSGKIISVVKTTDNNLQNLKSMNEELINLNNTINDTIQKQGNSVTQYYQDNADTNTDMRETFGKLLEERNVIRTMMGELETIKQENNVQRLKIDQGVSKYVVWGIIALIAMFITVKLVFFPETDVNIVKIFFNACIIILLVLWLMNLSSTTISIIVIFLIVMIIVSKVK